MNVRIRYAVTNEPNVLESTRLFQVGDASVRVSINTQALTYLIYNANTEVVVVSGSAVNLALLKKMVKNALIELGCVFSKESRVHNSNQLSA